MLKFLLSLFIVLTSQANIYQFRPTGEHVATYNFSESSAPPGGLFFNGHLFVVGNNNGDLTYVRLVGDSAYVVEHVSTGMSSINGLADFNTFVIAIGSTGMSAGNQVVRMQADGTTVESNPSAGIWRGATTDGTFFYPLVVGATTSFTFQAKPDSPTTTVSTIRVNTTSEYDIGHNSRDFLLLTDTGPVEGYSIHRPDGSIVMQNDISSIVTGRCRGITTNRYWENGELQPGRDIFVLCG